MFVYSWLQVLLRHWGPGANAHWWPFRSSMSSRSLLSSWIQESNAMPPWLLHATNLWREVQCLPRGWLLCPWWEATAMSPGWVRVPFKCLVCFWFSKTADSDLFILFQGISVPRAQLFQLLVRQGPITLHRGKPAASPVLKGKSETVSLALYVWVRDCWK